MSVNKTTKLKMNSWLENDPVDFEEINENFNIIDALPICIESGTKVGTYTKGPESTCTWRYKKFSDNTIEMSTKLAFDTLKCNVGSKSPYYSEESKVTFPFSFKEVYDVQMHLASTAIGWPVDVTGRTALDSVTFKMAAINSETDSIYKQVFVNVKGVLA